MALELKNTTFFGRLGHLLTKTFYGKAMKDHQKQIDSLYQEESKEKWDEFGKSVKDDNFVRALKNDPRSSEKLKTHAERLNMLSHAKPVAQVAGSKGKTYDVAKLSDGTYACTCNDWKYKGSVDPSYKCKHIKEYIVRNK